MGSTCCNLRLRAPEQFVRDILNSLKVRDLRYDAFTSSYKCSKTKDYLSHNIYDGSNKNPFLIFHSRFVDDFMEKQTNIFVWLFGLLNKDDNKIEPDGLLFKEDIKFNDFTNFIKDYINIHLSKTTSEISKIINERNVKGCKIKEYYIDKDFRQEFREYLKDSFAADKIERFSKDIIYRLEKYMASIGRSNVNFSMFVVNGFFRKYTYFTDAIKLREEFLRVYESK